MCVSLYNTHTLVVSNLYILTLESEVIHVTLQLSSKVDSECTLETLPYFYFFTSKIRMKEKCDLYYFNHGMDVGSSSMFGLLS